MRSRITRLAVVAAFLVPVLATTAPAQGFYAFSAAFAATVNLSGGLDYPCNPTSLGTLPCPPGPPSLDPLFLNDDPVPQGNLDWHHNTRTSTITSSTCVILGVAVLKPLAPATAGTCGFAGTGTVSGWCGLAGSQKTVNFFNGHSQVTIDLHIIVIGSTALFSGHWRKSSGQHGLVGGSASIMPPTPGATPGQSCVDKTAATFTLIGVAAFVANPVL